MTRRLSQVLGGVAAFTLVCLGTTAAQQFVPPPRTIADITAILEQEKPSPVQAMITQGLANTEPSKLFNRKELSSFYYDRCIGKDRIGELREAISDCQRAIEVGRGAVEASEMGTLRQRLAIEYNASGDPKTALEVLQQTAREVSALKKDGQKGWLFNVYRTILQTYIQLGDFDQAEAYLRRSQSLLQEAKSWRSYKGYDRAAWNADVENSRARLFEARGQFGEAELAYKRAEDFRREALSYKRPDDKIQVSAAQLQGAIDDLVVSQGRMKARQGRYAEGEADIRRVLLRSLKSVGKYNLGTNSVVGQLAGLLIEQGRLREAEQLTRVQIDVQKALGVLPQSQHYAASLSQLASILNLLDRWAEANAVYDEVESLTKDWEPGRREALQLNPDRVVAMYNTDSLQAGIAAAGRLLERQKQRFGEQHVDTALARGLLGIGLFKLGRNDEALGELKLAVAYLMARSRETDDEEATTAASRERRVRFVVESYIALLAHVGQTSGLDAAVESFRLADEVRSSSVQRALAASSARAAAKDPALSELERKEQDLTKQVNAQLGALNNLLAIPSAERDEKGAQQIQASIMTLRTERDKARQEIKQKFPAYADLVSPKPPSVAEIRTSLAKDEAMLAFYFGQNGSFVWAVPKSGPMAFATVNASIGDIETKIHKLREALEPQAAMISDIPPFDLKLGYELYELLLKPVESAWKPAKNLVVVTNGALGLLPLSLLPTAPAEVAADEDPLFIGYRKVPWLARTHAVSTVPSAAGLRTLRQLPPAKPGRGELVAFGDPYFNRDQQAEAEGAGGKVQVAEVGGNVTRGLPLRRRNSLKLDGVDSAELGLLPRLPDTAEELKSIALALQADPSKVLYLGKNAAESAVKTMNLSGFRILAFATHGLVPGELNGLTQPALALSSPAVTGESGDGLLTMEEILGLKLDADWVILSACNTGAGAGAGAEAASGLGRAFFYAGTRALLVTNWSVHSQSARQLVTDLFKRQADDPKLSRSEALRQAMMALVDGPGYLDKEGKTEFAYAHPLFWAPYTIIGDGGVR